MTTAPSLLTSPGGTQGWQSWLRRSSVCPSPSPLSWLFLASHRCSSGPLQQLFLIELAPFFWATCHTAVMTFLRHRGQSTGFPGLSRPEHWLSWPHSPATTVRLSLLPLPPALTFQSVSQTSPPPGSLPRSPFNTKDGSFSSLVSFRDSTLPAAGPPVSLSSPRRGYLKVQSGLPCGCSNPSQVPACC